MMRFIRNLLGNADGAVAPIVALSLIGLVATGGIAFDYAHLAAMDTELQDAADHAALAAATQLDGQTGACARAAAAASSLLTNNTRFANDIATRAISVSQEGTCDGTGSIQFYQDYIRASDTPGAAATSDANALVVMVSVTPREAFYTLTPIVAAFHSGSVGAQAAATLSSAICKEPPIMICNPGETGGNTSFDPSTYVGKGLRLVDQGGGNGAWAPGNFGYLDTGFADGRRASVRLWAGTPHRAIAPQPRASTLNLARRLQLLTRSIRVSTSMTASQAVCPNGGTCSASINSTKDIRRPANANGNNACKLHNQGWQLDTSGTGYYGQTVPATATALPVTTIPSAMGYPRDLCHAVSLNGSCADRRIGIRKLGLATPISA